MTHTYALSNDPKTKFADWVAYEVDVTNFGKSPGRDWSSDPLLPAGETLEEDDYKGAHSSTLEADRGHQAPLASFAGSKYWYELNYLSNITPQDKDLNQGPWRDLEQRVRDAVSYGSNLWVITGPIYSERKRRLPNADEEHIVPDAYFKVVYDQSGSSAAFIMPQTASRDSSACSFSSSLEGIHARTGFHLPSFSSSDSILIRLDCKNLTEDSD